MLTDSGGEIMEAMRAEGQRSADLTGGQIRLSGDLSINNAQSLHQTLLNTTMKHSNVDVHLHDVTGFDVSTIQLLLAAGKEPGLNFSISMGDNTESVQKWLATAGLSGMLCP